MTASYMVFFFIAQHSRIKELNVDIHVDRSQGGVLSENSQIKPKLIIARK